MRDVNFSPVWWDERRYPDGNGACLLVGGAGRWSDIYPSLIPNMRLFAGSFELLTKPKRTSLGRDG